MKIINIKIILSDTELQLGAASPVPCPGSPLCWCWGPQKGVGLAGRVAGTAAAAQG